MGYLGLGKLLVQEGKQDVYYLLGTAILEDAQHYPVYYFYELVWLKVDAFINQILSNEIFMLILIYKLEQGKLCTMIQKLLINIIYDIFTTNSLLKQINLVNNLFR